jgi:hypothetical protein
VISIQKHFDTLKSYYKSFFPSPTYSKLNPQKIALIDFAFRNINPMAKSFADLGGVWNVDGGYTFYTLDSYEISYAFLVDCEITPKTNNDARKYDNLTLIENNFADEVVAKKLGYVDVIFLFDVLLHQVDPNWEEILEQYSQVTNCFAVFNPQWIISEETVRLLDFGVDEYFKNVPHTGETSEYNALFEHMYDVHPIYKKIWRDIPDVWQWGITDRDLSQKMESLGFVSRHYKNYGKFASLKNFENHAFLFQKEL